MVESVKLEAPFPPFLYSWSPCGTRLAMLSNWHLRRCAVSLDNIAREALDGEVIVQEEGSASCIICTVGRRDRLEQIGWRSTACLPPLGRVA